MMLNVCGFCPSVVSRSGTLTNVVISQIRMKRLAKLQASTTQSSSPSPSPNLSTSSILPKSKPKPIPAPTPKRAPEAPVTSSLVPPKKKVVSTPARFDYTAWENETITTVFKATLDVRLFVISTLLM